MNFDELRRPARRPDKKLLTRLACKRPGSEPELEELAQAQEAGFPFEAQTRPGMGMQIGPRPSAGEFVNPWEEHRPSPPLPSALNDVARAVRGTAPAPVAAKKAAPKKKKRVRKPKTLKELKESSARKLAKAAKKADAAKMARAAKMASTAKKPGSTKMGRAAKMASAATIAGAASIAGAAVAAAAPKAETPSVSDAKKTADALQTDKSPWFAEMSSSSIATKPVKAAKIETPKVDDSQWFTYMPEPLADTSVVAEAPAIFSGKIEAGDAPNANESQWFTYLPEPVDAPAVDDAPSLEAVPEVYKEYVAPKTPKTDEVNSWTSPRTLIGIRQKLSPQSYSATELNFFSAGEELDIEPGYEEEVKVRWWQRLPLPGRSEG
jgi:hypothetical protein